MSPPLAVSDNRRGRGGGRPPKRPKEGDVREIGPRSDNGVLKNRKPIWRKPRTKVSTKPNKRYFSSGCLHQCGHPVPVDGEEINEGQVVINHQSPVSNCPCCQPLSEVEVPGEIPNLDLLSDRLLVNFFRYVPDIPEFCKSCKK